MPHLRKILMVLLVATLAAAGCAGTQSKIRSNQFESRSWDLLRAIRWGDYDRAVACIAQEAEPLDPALFEAVKVSDYKAGAWRISDDAMRMEQPVTFRYYRVDAPVERSTTVEMVWRYDPDERNWFLVSGFPAFSSFP